MTKQVIYLEVEPKVKEQVRKLADAERRTITSFMLFLIDKKIAEVKNANK